MASLASQLVARGHAVTLITLDDGAIERHQVDRRVVRQRLDLPTESRGLKAKLLNTRHRIHRLRTAILDETPDVVLSFCDRTNILALTAAKNLGFPVVVSERSDPSQQQLGTLWEYLRHRTYPRATAIIALTETSANSLRARFASPVQVIPSAVDVPPLRSDREAAIGRRRIIGVGRLETEKGFDRLVDAFASFSGDLPDWSLRILGEGSRRGSLEQQIRDLGLSDRVTMPGWIRPVWEELAAATIFALPSRYEGFPSALLEAMAVGVPSVAVDCASGPRAVIDDLNTGLLVANEVVGLSDGIRRLIADDELRERIGAAGQKVVERFAWDKMVDAYESVLLNAASQREPRR